MIRISREISKDATTQHSASCLYPINAYKMSTTTALKTHTASLMASPLFNNNGYASGDSGGSMGGRKMKSNTVASVMTSLAADLCKVTKGKQTTTSPPMEAAGVVVNSIIYSKPSFCSIVVDIGDKQGTPAAKLPANIENLANDKNFNSRLQSAANKVPASNVNQCDCPLLATTSHPDSDAAHVYMMSTIMNGSIHHHISEICDNLISMGLFGMVEESEHDDESLVEFSYDDNDTEDDDGDDIEFLHTDEDVKRLEDYDIEDDDEDDDSDDDDDEDYDDYRNNNNVEDYETDDEDTCLFTCDGEDVTDFCRVPMFSSIPAPLFNSEKKKKVRFNTKPTVHVMRTWDYAYRAARKGEWEMYARDRERFKLRIQRAALTLNPILNREHRQKVYEQRFATLYEEEKEKRTEEEKKEKGQSSSTTQSPNQQQVKNVNQNQKKKKHRKKRRKRRRPNF